MLAPCPATMLACRGQLASVCPDAGPGSLPYERRDQWVKGSPARFGHAALTATALRDCRRTSPLPAAPCPLPPAPRSPLLPLPAVTPLALRHTWLVVPRLTVTTEVRQRVGVATGQWVGRRAGVRVRAAAWRVAPRLRLDGCSAAHPVVAGVAPGLRTTWALVCRALRARARDAAHRARATHVQR